jgi:hypothetical protein
VLGVTTPWQPLSLQIVRRGAQITGEWLLAPAAPRLPFAPAKDGMNRGLPRLSARHSREMAMPELEGGPEMTVVAGFDVHRRQITFDALDTDTGELMRGRIDATISAVEGWAARFEDREVQVALEACTGWLFVSRALERAGAVPHLAEPVETSALRGRKRRAKTDREDARWLRTLLSEGRLPES